MPKNSKIEKISELTDLMIDASIDRVMAVDTDWRIIFWNKTSEIISGISRSEILGKPVVDAFPEMMEDLELIQAFEHAMNGKKTFLLPDHRFQSRKFYENHFIPLKNENDDLIGVVNFMHDVSHRLKGETELKNLHSALKDQFDYLEKKNAELAIFTGITGRDLKEPIRKLYTGMEMLIHSDGKNLSDNSKAGLRRMQASLTKMSLLLDDILSFTSIINFSEKFANVDLNEILRNTLHSLSVSVTEKKAIIESEQLPFYRGSAEMLHYLFYNIVENALKFQEPESIPVIKITAQVVAYKTSVTDVEPSSFLCISFTDNGIGFNNEDNKRIFKMFERLHKGNQFVGAGIGLTISQRIAQAHGGYIEADSEPGNGAVFRCYLAIRS